MKAIKKQLLDLVKELKQGDVRHVDPQRLVIFLQSLVKDIEIREETMTDEVMYELGKREIGILNEQLYTMYGKYMKLIKEMDYLKAKLHSCEDLLEQFSIKKLK
tara:strand:- start:8518 stop:8829 length:312 start_codon:yes stop_codon:yes gene_type:complete